MGCDIPQKFLAQGAIAFSVYGSGAHGDDLALSGALTEDKEYGDVTLSGDLELGGHTLRVCGTLTIPSGIKITAHAVSGDGGGGGPGGGGVGGTAGTGGSPSGGGDTTSGGDTAPDGGVGGTGGPGGSGTDSPAITIVGGAGGDGGDGSGGVSFGGTALGVTTKTRHSPFGPVQHWDGGAFFDLKPGQAGASGGGGIGGIGGGGGGGQGGASGGYGRVFAKTIVNAGDGFQSLGAAGGAGGDGEPPDGGAGGPGGGGGSGCWLICFEEADNLAPGVDVLVTVGAAGAAAALDFAAPPATAATPGSVGGGVLWNTKLGTVETF